MCSSAAMLIAISLPCSCELVWLLLRGVKLTQDDVAATVRDLLELGMSSWTAWLLRRGWLCWKLAVILPMASWPTRVKRHGGETFVSFDERAVALLSKHGKAAQFLT